MECFVYAALMLWGIVALARRGAWLPLVLVALATVFASLLIASGPAVMVIPRYFLFLLPAAYIAIAAALSELWGLLRWLRMGLVALVAGILLVAYPVVPVW